MDVQSSAIIEENVRIGYSIMILYGHGNKAKPLQTSLYTEAEQSLNLRASKGFVTDGGPVTWSLQKMS